ncbi:MAG: FtsX-like permease family protein [Romboutsia sp.]|uniref:ABC transporter permease n=1 Tax=Romboutsia sp. TaxID=1965302 RepID=UPI003F39BEB9
MLFKLSSRNVKRSIRDYSIYFLTLVLGVCIFYIFNSLESQTIMIDLSQSRKSYVELISNVISVVSVLVSFILGFLVIYANNFIIKRRNKEFGIYMTLGISKNKISFMLFFETIIIGILSLVVGIFIGAFLSQGLASITAKVFESNMSKYQFIFSKEACLKTILYFGLMFIMVMFLNFIIVSRCNLIDLINSEKTNQKLKGTNLILSVILFILAILCLGFAYKLILENKLVDIANKEFKTSIILGIVGTLLFFRALAGFLIKVTQNSKNYYLKNLNTFTLRQLNSKINTHYISMSIICLMLFIAIGMSSTGIGMKKTLEKTAQFQTPYDMTLYQDMEGNDNKSKLAESLSEIGIDVKDYSNELVNYNLYNNDISFKEMFKDTEDEVLKKQITVMIDLNVPLLKISDYNKLKKMKNKPEVNLKEDEVLLLTDMSMMKSPIKEYVSKNDTIDINNNELKLKKEYEYNPIETSPMSMNGLTLIVDDKIVEDLGIHRKYLSLNYKGDKIVTEEKVLKDFDNLINETQEVQDFKISAMTKMIAIDANMGSANMFLYVGIYIGIVFLIASAAVLALSQLSGATESIERYNVLRKLGVSSEMINKSIFIEVLLYFFLPISLALVHSVYGIKVANEMVKAFGDYDMIGNNIFSIGTILGVYGIYFIATYNGYKRIVNK